PLRVGSGRQAKYHDMAEAAPKAGIRRWQISALADRTAMQARARPDICADPSWSPIPQTFRSSEGSLPQPWEDIFGPLRRGQVDDLMLVGQCGQSIDARIATAT